MANVNFTNRQQIAGDEARLERSDAILLGAPFVLIVMAVSAMCCIILLKWKMKDRMRQSGNVLPCDVTSQTPEQRRRETEGRTLKCGFMCNKIK